VIVFITLVVPVTLNTAHGQPDIGVIFVVHGGMDTNTPQGMWDAAILQFSFEHNHSVYQFVIWNSANWSLVLDTTVADFTLKFLRMFEFEYERIGGYDSFHDLSEEQMADIKTELDTNPNGLTFAVDWAGYMPASRPEHYPNPRYVYYGPDGIPDPGGNYDDVKYCGEDEAEGVVLEFDAGASAFSVGATLTGQVSGATAVIDEVTVESGDWGTNDAAGFISLSNVSGSFEDGETIADDGTPGSAAASGTTHWLDCDPERYNVDGPVERLLNQGVSRIIVVDWMMGGARYSKSFDVVEMLKRAIDNWNDAQGTSIPHPVWINDYSNLMVRSYPTEPAGWTLLRQQCFLAFQMPIPGSFL
jgi:hypothetical protein